MAQRLPTDIPVVFLMSLHHSMYPDGMLNLPGALLSQSVRALTGWIHLSLKILWRLPSLQPEPGKPAVTVAPTRGLGLQKILKLMLHLSYVCK